MSSPSRSPAERPGPAPAALLVALCLSLSVAPARASKPRLHLERIDARACASTGRVLLFASELELEGILRPRPFHEYRLLVDGRAVDRAPVEVTTFAKTGAPLHLALVLQNSEAFRPHLDLIKEGGATLVRALPPAARLTIITYDWQARRLASAAPPRQALRSLESLEPTDAAVDLALTAALETGLRSLETGPGDARRLLAVVSDGINATPTREVFRAVGSRARALHVPIHPVAFSPADDRGPLLNLGEIAKRSGGTLRWAQGAARLRTELANLGREIGEQLVLTFDVPDRCARSHTLHLVGGSLRSAALSLPAQQGKTAPAARSPRRVLALLGLVAVVAAMALVTLWLLRAQRRGRKNPVAPPEVAAPEEPLDDERPASPRATRHRSRATEPLAPGLWLIGASPDLLSYRARIPEGRSHLGSGGEAEVRLPSQTGVAPVHAALHLDAGRLILEDLGAAAGTLVNGQRVARSELTDGDLLQLGRAQLLVRRL